jgi:hypothetical protein
MTLDRRFTEKNLIIPLVPEASDVNPALDFDSFCMKKYDRATIIIQFSAALTGDNVLTVNTGKTNGTKTTAMTFRYRLGSAAPKNAGADVLGTPATSAALTLTAATYQGKVLVIEISASEVEVNGAEHDWVTVALDGAASVGTCMAFAILSDAKYPQATMPTAIS